MFDPLRRTDPDVFEFPWINFLVPRWEPGEMYVVGQVVRPRVANGFFAECVAGNQSAAIEPRWSARSGATIVDGSVTWAMRAPTDVSVPAISDVTYTITPAGITQSGPVTDGTITRVKLDASAADLGSYVIVAEITAGGEDYSQEESLEVID